MSSLKPHKGEDPEPSILDNTSTEPKHRYESLPKLPILHNSLYCKDNPRELPSDKEISGLQRKPSKLKSKLSDEIKHLSPSLKSVKSHEQLAKTANGVRSLARNLNKATIKLNVRSVMIITKARDNSLIYLTKELTEWLLRREPHMDIYVDHHLEKSRRFDPKSIWQEIPTAQKHLKFWNKALIRDCPDMFDLVITLGGDGTVLYASTLFQRVVPPVLSFSLGSLGFLTNFAFEDFASILTDVLENGVRTNLRMRFTCRAHKENGELMCEQQALNELTVDRGPSPWVSMLELYGDGSLLTVAQADGLIIATPTGSTAYSISAGGSLVHPSVSAISVTPICPHTLSFRPILLPDSMTLRIKVPARSRSTAWASFDGRSRVELLKGYYVTVAASPFPFPTVRSSKNEYFDSVSRVLNWNSREEQKSFVHLLSDKNKESYNQYHSGRTAAGNIRSGQSRMNSIGNPQEESEQTNMNVGRHAYNRVTDSLRQVQLERRHSNTFEIDYNDSSSSDDNNNQLPGEASDSTIELEDNAGDNYFVPLPGEGINTPVPQPFLSNDSNVHSMSSSRVSPLHDGLDRASK